VNAQSGEPWSAASIPWAVGHPGFAALVASAASYAGLACVLVGLAEGANLGRAGLLGQFWEMVLVVGGAAIFIAALPASLGFAGASCATQRELWPGVVGGFATFVLTLVVLGIMLPARPFA
jgi:hypothetical protein